MEKDTNDEMKFIAYMHIGSVEMSFSFGERRKYLVEIVGDAAADDEAVVTNEYMLIRDVILKKPFF